MHRLSRRILRGIQRGPKLAYAIGLGPLIGQAILLLTTTGRKSGLPRTVPLQYEVGPDGAIYLGAALGERADWYRNILADPCVRVQIGRRAFEGLAEPVSDPARIADFLELRLRNHPRMVRAILKADGVSGEPSREELEKYAETLKMVILRPLV